MESITAFPDLVFQFAQLNTNLYIFGIVPFLSLTTRLTFRKKGFNLTEIFVYYLYFYGQFMFCATLANVVYLVPWWDAVLISTALTHPSYFIVFIYMQKEFFETSWFDSVIKGVTVLLPSTALYWLVIFCVFQGVKWIF